MVLNNGLDQKQKSYLELSTKINIDYATKKQ